MRILLACIFTLLSLTSLLGQKTTPAHSGKTQSPPTIPVGWDIYRQWDKWPLQRIGVRAYMRGTYNRSGGNTDMSNYLFMKEEDYNVTLDVIGKGTLYFFRTNFWHGSPWHFNIDDRDHQIKETATDDPVHAREKLTKTAFIPDKPFPEPIAWTWGTTKGADLIWTPIPFERSLQLAYSRTSFGTGYYIYHLYGDETNLSRPIRSWDINAVPDTAVTKFIASAGTDIAPAHIKKMIGSSRLENNRTTIASIKTSPSVIRAFKLSLPLQKAIDLERIRLIITWDDRKQPSVDAPLCLFFGAGTFFNRESKEYLVKGLPINIRYDYKNQKVELACYYPMPFFSSARIELVNTNSSDAKIDYEIRYEQASIPKAYSSYFHATYQDIPKPEMGKDMVILDTRGTEGSNEWSGNFAGTSMIFSHDGTLNTLEGDPRFFFDDSDSPQGYGTGTEEWSGGGFYWGGENMTLPLAGHPCGAPSKQAAKGEKDLIESSYRFLLADLMPFGRRARIQFEHGGENLSSEHYETLTYWYGLPMATLIKTDEIDIGNEVSEKKHSYFSPQASEPQTIVSRYELGIDTFPIHPWAIPGRKDTILPENYQQYVGKEVFPPQTMDGRYSKGTSELTVKISPDNKGVLLRRTLDYRYPNQKAAIYIAGVDEETDNTNLAWKFAGIWYTAGSNTSVFSFPRGELDKRQYNIQTSNRFFRDDEFLIPAALSKGHPSLKIRIKFQPVDQQLYPGKPYPVESAWSELKYKVYSYTLPKFSIH